MNCDTCGGEIGSGTNHGDPKVPLCADCRVVELGEQLIYQMGLKEKVKAELARVLNVADAPHNHTCGIGYEIGGSRRFLKDLEKGPVPEGFRDWHDYEVHQIMSKWPQWKKDAANQMAGRKII